MTGLADMLEALHLAPRLATFHGVGTFRSDTQSLMEWMQSTREIESGGFSVGASITARVGAFTTEGTYRAEGAGESSQDRVEVWLDATRSPSRWRADQGSNIVTAGEHVAQWGPHGGQQRPRNPLSDTVPTGWERVLAGGTTAALHHFDPPATDTIAGRPCWHTTGRARDDSVWPHHFAAFRTVPGDAIELWVDQQTGVLLAWIGRHGDTVLGNFRFSSVSVDEPIADDVFDHHPEGQTLVTYDESLRQMLRSRGIETDSTDPDELQRLVHQAMTGRPAPGVDPASTAQERARSFTPTGPAPNDEENARIDIGIAFEGLAATSDDGEDLLNVEHGTGLGQTVAAATRRFPNAGEIDVTVNHIKFLNPREAVVWFTIAVTQMTVPFEGRAILTTTGWKISRATIGDVLARAGVAVPPPDHS